MYNSFTGVLTGTSGAAFTVVRKMEAGVVGYRSLGGDQYRVRVEPFATAAGGRVAFDSDWNGPTGDPKARRFSKVVSEENLADTIVEAAEALSDAETVPVADQIEAALTAAGF